jgi:hypothetical protein
MTTLSELAERVEAAQGPDRELDWLIATATGSRIGEHEKFLAFHYTKELDAAVALCERVLPGTAYQVTKKLNGKCYALVQKKAAKGVCFEWWSESRDVPIPALALVAATLRALSTERRDG